MADVGKGLALLLGSVLGSPVSPRLSRCRPPLRSSFLLHPCEVSCCPVQLAVARDPSARRSWYIKAAEGKLTAPEAAPSQSCVGHPSVRASLPALGEFRKTGAHLSHAVS